MRQDTIGWHLLLRGFLAPSWIQVQHAHLRMFPAPRQHLPQTWELTVTRLLLYLGVGIWKGRNNFIHGRDASERRECAREAVVRRTRDIYANPPMLLRRSPHPSEAPLTIRLTKSTRVLEARAKQVDQKARISELERQRDRERFGTIL